MTQQAAEKLLKAVLASIGRAPPRTHDLGYLLGLLEEAGTSLPPDSDQVKALNPWATEFRYEDTFGKQPDREVAVALVKSLRAWANGILRGE